MDATRLKSLDKIAIYHETDRASKFSRTYGKPHDFARHYDMLFSPIRNEAIKLLEIGSASGEGIRMWMEYFTAGLVYGVDNVSDTCEWNIPGEIGRFTFEKGDQGDEKFWKQFIAYYGADWDVVIDDGSHKNTDIITSFMALWPHVKRGGFYCIEDLGVAYGGVSFFVDPRWPNQVDWLKGKIDELNRGGEIDSIYFSRELAIIKKGI